MQGGDGQHRCAISPRNRTRTHNKKHMYPALVLLAKAAVNVCWKKRPNALAFGTLNSSQ